MSIEPGAVVMDATATPGRFSDTLHDCERQPNQRDNQCHPGNIDPFKGVLKRINLQTKVLTDLLQFLADGGLVFLKFFDFGLLLWRQ